MKAEVAVSCNRSPGGCRDFRENGQHGEQISAVVGKTGRSMNQRWCHHRDLCRPADEVRHPPQSGWLDERGRLKGGRPRWLERRASRDSVHA